LCSGARRTCPSWVARRLGGSCAGYEVDLELGEAVEEMLKTREKPLLPGERVEVVVRGDARTLREEVERKLSGRSRQ